MGSEMCIRDRADPLKTTQAFASAASTSGATVLTRHGVNAVRQVPDGSWQVKSSWEHGGTQEFRAGTLVLGAGAWCGPVGAMLGIRIPIVPVRGQMWATAIVPPSVFHTIGSVESLHDWSLSANYDSDAPPELTHQGENRITTVSYTHLTLPTILLV